MEANAEMWQLLCLCSTQWEAGFAGPTSLKWEVVMKVSVAKGIETDSIFFEKLKAFETEILKGMNKKDG